MSAPVAFTEIWRGDRIESLHLGHAVICTPDGGISQVWGDAQTVIYPRSSAKMIQALPLVESGAADAAGLTSEHLALACASHNGAAIHTERVARWLADLGLDDDDLRCGAHPPYDTGLATQMTCRDEAPRQVHNNCSGKHAGFLTLNQQLGGGPDYEKIDHPVQQAVLEAWQDITGETPAGWEADGCSAPNFASSLHGIARAMAFFAAASPEGATMRERAAARLRNAMVLHPELVAGEGRACTELMRATDGAVAVKTGAEGVFVAILPEQKLGVALKVCDGATRASEASIAALLVRLGVLPGDHPATRKVLDAPIVNARGRTTGSIRAAAALR